MGALSLLTAEPQGAEQHAGDQRNESAARTSGDISTPAERSREGWGGVIQLGKAFAFCTPLLEHLLSP